MSGPASGQDRRAPTALIVTGMSGAGRTTAINALEDLGYESFSNFPVSLFESLLKPVADTGAPVAIGIEARTRGFSPAAVGAALNQLRNRPDAGAQLIFLDCDDATLISRFSQTRRRHPLAPDEDAATGVLRERDLLEPLRELADTVIDTSDMSPHDLKATLGTRFSTDSAAGLAITLNSFAYKRGLPEGTDMALDCRFLRNPYWENTLRPLDGRDAQVQSFVREDPRYESFFSKLSDMMLLLLPAYKAEGKAYLSVAMGCTGGRHRSVAVTEHLAKALANAGWPVAIRHRELERHAAEKKR